MSANPPTAALIALLRRELAKQMVTDDLRDGTTPQQLGYMQDESSLIGLIATRRAGKSRTVVRDLLDEALQTRGGRFLYLNETRDECKRVAWTGINGDGFIPLIAKMGITARINKTELSITFPDLDCIIQLVGADDERAINKFRGGAYHRVVIDEAQKFPHLKEFVDSVLSAAMFDFRGAIVLVGTPSRECSGLFYEATTGEAQGWSVHRLSILENPYFGTTSEERYERTVGEYLKRTGKSLDDPDVRREFFAEWVKEDQRFVYPVLAVPESAMFFAPVRELPDGTPDLHAAIDDLPVRFDGTTHQWFYVVGADLGYSPDPFAYVAWAWCRELPNIYEVASWAATELIPDEQVAILMRVNEILRPVDMVGDAGGIGKGVIKGWSRGWMEREALPIAEADKAQKTTHIELFGNDIRRQFVKLRRGGRFYSEAVKHVYVIGKTGKYVESKKTKNDVLDAGLYGWRSANHFRSEEPDAKPAFGTPEWSRDQEKRMEENHYARIAAEQYDF